jgi:hypothetical protein
LHFGFGSAAVLGGPECGTDVVALTERTSAALKKVVAVQRLLADAPAESAAELLLAICTLCKARATLPNWIGYSAAPTPARYGREHDDRGTRSAARRTREYGFLGALTLWTRVLKMGIERSQVWISRGLLAVRSFQYPMKSMWDLGRQRSVTRCWRMPVATRTHRLSTRRSGLKAGWPL